MGTTHPGIDMWLWGICELCGAQAGEYCRTYAHDISEVKPWAGKPYIPKAGDAESLYLHGGREKAEPLIMAMRKACRTRN